MTMPSRTMEIELQSAVEIGPNWAAIRFTIWSLHPSRPPTPLSYDSYIIIWQNQASDGVVTLEMRASRDYSFQGEWKWPTAK